MHNLDFNSERNTYSYMGTQKAWHGLGQIVTEAKTAQEALVLSNMDFDVIKVPVPAGEVEINGEKFMVKDPTKNYVIRTDTAEVLGTVGSTYTVLQNRDAFSFFDNIVDKDEAIYETAGVIRGGRRIWIAAKMPSYIKVGNEDIEQYVVITNGHDGKSGCTAFLTQVRIVCENTLRYGISSAMNKVSIPHRSKIAEKIKMAHQVLGMSNKYNEEISDIWNAMAKKQVTEKITMDYLLKLYPTHEDSSIVTVTDKFREDIMEYINSDATVQTKETKHTVWGLVQSINGWYQHKKKYRPTSNFTVEDVKLNSIWDGSTQKKNQQAFDLALTLI